MSSRRFRVRGMDCAEEIGALKRALRDLGDVETLRFDTLAGVMEVPSTFDHRAVVKAVAGTGMRAVPIDEGTPERSWWARNRLRAIVIASGLGTVGGFATHAALAGLTGAVGSEGMAGAVDDVPIPAVLLYAVAVASGLTLVLPKAWFAAKSFRPDMNLLMTLAVAGAVGLGEWFEASTVSFLFAVSLALESWSVGRARNAVEALLALAPSTVWVHRGDTLVEVDPAEVPEGSMFVVKPGERFGLDGVVVSGLSDVDQAPITGESVPVEKAPGDSVFSGTINGNGLLEVRSSAPASDTTLAQIVKMVGEARTERSDAERWVERFSRIYTPMVFAAALVVFLVPPLFFGGAWNEWFYRALVLLVIGCPCALVISTPVAVVSGLAAAARNGVLVKAGRFLEVPATLRVVAVDKTGTLTEGRLRVAQVIVLGDHTQESLLSNAGAIESKSEHPIARAITAAAHERGLPNPDASDVEIAPGRGTSGVVTGRHYWLGSHRWLTERGLETPEIRTRLETLAQTGHTAVVVGSDDHVCGIIALADTIRADARASIAALHRAGIERVVMLTGDNAGTASVVAKAVGLDDVRAELLPADKVAAVEALASEVGPVAMIGDGVNDAPALARASLGVAMGALGTDVAIEAADVALMTDDLSKLAWLISHSQRTIAIIRQNTVFALGVKALFVVLTFAGAASLWAAIVADIGASLLVVFNALRLLRPEAQPIRS